jgi:hypothetical protein
MYKWTCPSALLFHVRRAGLSYGLSNEAVFTLVNISCQWNS